MLKLAICEDNDIQRRQIHTLSCSSLEIPVEIDTFSSATDFLNQISNEQCPYHENNMIRTLLIGNLIEKISGRRKGINFDWNFKRRTG